MQKGVTTLGRFLLEEQRKYSYASGEFTAILEQIAFVAKVIGRDVNKAGLINILGQTGSTNSHGEEQQKLDVYAHTKVIQALDHLGKVFAMASEEEKEIIHIPEKFPKGKYLVVFDPLDGSSNIDVNISIGTIFGIFKKKSESEAATIQDFLQPGKNLVASGYVIYGSSTMFVYTTGNGVNGFTLDPSIGEFLLSHPAMKMPEYGQIYSANESNSSSWKEEVVAYIDCLRNYPERKYTSRYIGSLVADFHRNLLKGGVFLYPEDKQYPQGKLRLLYEIIPLAFIAEQAGGSATDGENNIMDLVPKSLHERTPVVIGSTFEIALYQQFIKEGIRKRKKKFAKSGKSTLEKAIREPVI